MNCNETAVSSGSNLALIKKYFKHINSFIFDLDTFMKFKYTLIRYILFPQDWNEIVADSQHNQEKH